MDAFDFNEGSSGNFNGNMIWKLGAGFFLLSTVCLLLFFFLTFVNPYNSFNPFPPATPFPTPDLLILTDTPIPVPATPTNTPEIPSQVPATTQPPATPDGGTLAATLGLSSQTPATTTEVTPEPNGGPSYVVSGQQTFTTHVDGCNGAYIAGNVTNINGSPEVFMTLRIGGTLNDVPVSDETFSGNAPNYSESGWEFKIADAPVTSTGTIFVQLLTKEGEAVSELIIINTSDICSENVTLVNFVQVR